MTMSPVSATGGKPARILLRLQQLQEKERAIQQREIDLERRMLALEQKALQEKYRLLEQQLVKRKYKDRPKVSLCTTTTSTPADDFAPEITGSRAGNIPSTAERCTDQIGISGGELNTHSTNQASEKQSTVSEPAEQLEMMDYSTTANRGTQQRNTRASSETALSGHLAPICESRIPNDGKNTVAYSDGMQQNTFAALITPTVMEHTTSLVINQPVEHDDLFYGANTWTGNHAEWGTFVDVFAPVAAEKGYSNCVNFAKLQQYLSGQWNQEADGSSKLWNSLEHRISTAWISGCDFLDVICHDPWKFVAVVMYPNEHSRLIQMRVKPQPDSTKSLLATTTRQKSAFVYLVFRIYRWILESHTVTLTDMHLCFDLITIQAMLKWASSKQHSVRKKSSCSMEIQVTKIVYNIKRLSDYECTRAGMNNCHITGAYQNQVSYQDKVLVGCPGIENNLFWYFLGIDTIPQQVIDLVLRTA
ncbi:uncharacterized protein LOC115263351 isoform X2 [Aedes albopictus]|uniref:Uncharacterized protein n=1 Tax=Aedes albopictus TaxID=7160 RepID=A0ABM1Y8M9_AEDAL